MPTVSASFAPRPTRGRLTILYAARDREHNNAVVLAELLHDDDGQTGDP